jgi:hypothetical protein
MFIKSMKMHLYIAANRLIGDVQKEFTDIFPFLKLEFFDNKSFARSDFTAQQIISSSRLIGNGQMGIKNSNIEINGEMKVSELENIFRDKYKLAVQVFRKSCNLWLETTMTDNWTLSQQNKHGREISTVKNINIKADDYDLNRDATH